MSTESKPLPPPPPLPQVPEEGTLPDGALPAPVLDGACHTPPPDQATDEHVARALAKLVARLDSARSVRDLSKTRVPSLEHPRRRRAPVGHPVHADSGSVDGEGPAAVVDVHPSGRDSPLPLEPKLHPLPVPSKRAIQALLEETKGRAGYGLVRYEQHGEAVRRGKAFRVFMAHSRSWFVQKLGAHEWFARETWRAGVTEMVGMTLYNFFQQSLVLAAHRMAGTYTAPADTQPPPSVYSTPIIAFGTIVLIALLIFAMSPLSGAHFNPLVTASTMCTGLMSLARGLVYLMFQFAGGFLGSWFVYVVAEHDAVEVAATNGAGCGGPASGVSDGAAVLSEFMAAFFLLYILHQLLFDLQQHQVFGAVVGPLLFTFSIGVLIVCSQVVFPSLGLNVTRCLPNAIIWGNARASKQWIIVVGDLLAVLIHAMLKYNIFAPHHVHVLHRALRDIKSAKKTQPKEEDPPQTV